MLITGSPGADKTLIVHSRPVILPKIIVEEALDVTPIYSVTNQLPLDQPFVQYRPFYSPHYTVSYTDLVDNGHWPKRGGISLAHRDVLFLDEWVGFSLHLLTTMRQPLDNKVISISRPFGLLTYPDDFTLIVSANLCRIGFYSDSVENDYSESLL